MADYSHLPFRPCVGITLFNAAGEVFVGERIDTPGAWQMPQGGIDEGEDIEVAARRELAEETGIENATLIKIGERTLKYTLPDHLIEKLWQGRFQGQEQHWVAMRFEGDDAQVNLQAHTPPEFSAWQWLALEQTLDKIVPFKRELYAEVIELFSDITDAHLRI